ncbi:MAG: amino acid adenylation domain-containing protein [Peptococcaceae bacterium]|nr:amino acid adenylation domain-containing protein [Peptococcaceae bacterium]
MSSSKISSQVQAIYSLTPLQQGMLYQKIYDENAPVNILQYTLRIRGTLDETLARDALRLVTAKHDALRTLILYRKVEKPRQVVLKERDPDLNALDLRGNPDVDACVQRLLEDDMSHGFDLERDPLLRLTLVRINDEESLIIWSMHHIIVDGWCLTILSDDFVSFYHNLSAGRPYDDLHAKIRLQSRWQTTYEDYVTWIGSQPDDAAAYWRSLLEGYSEPALVIPTKRDTPGSGLMRVLVPAELETRIKALASDLNITVNAILETAWGLALQRSAYTCDAVFGKVVSGRDAEIAGLDGVVGLFVNTIPVRIATDEIDTVEDLLRKTHEQALASARQRPRSLAEIQQQSPLGNALVQVLFIYENHIQLDTEKLTLLGMDITEQTIREHTGYPLVLKAWHDTNLNLDVAYSEDYGELEMELLATRLMALLDQMTRTPSRRVRELDFITPHERALILGSFNDTATPWPEDKVYSQLFEEQVKAHPARIAVCFRNDRMTYADLNRQADAVAHKLRTLGIGAESIVAILSQRDPALLIGLLGIMKAGGAYLPIEPDLPEARIRFMLEDSGAKAILTTNLDLSWTNLPVVNMDSLITQFESDSQPPDSSPPLDIDPDYGPGNLAYCIYTSGTTGRPKGVLLEQRNLVCFCASPFPLVAEKPKNPLPTFLSACAFCFDVFIFETLFPLAQGWTVALSDEDERKEQAAFAQLVERHPGAIAMLTPSHLRLLTSATEDRSFLAKLSLLFLGGEPFPPGQYNDLRRDMDSPIVNLYGPTETSVWTSGGEVGALGVDIGRPIPNRQLYILNGTTLCGIGTPGELCIAGPGVGRGYLNLAVQTAEAFVPNPFGPGRLYRTGDLARWLPNGRIEHLSRIDGQVKIRGNRIELGEIETAMRQQPGIKDAAVIISTGGESDGTELWGYVVSNSTIDFLLLKNALAESLPDYMIPSRLAQIERIPLNANGKTDKNALPTITQTDSSGTYSAPRDDEEVMAAQALTKALNLNRPIGIHENFFDLGGHSLRAVRAVNILETLSGIRLSLKSLFAFPTVEGIAALLREAKEALPEKPLAKSPACTLSDLTTDALPLALPGKLPAAPAQTSYPMSPAQRRLFAVCQIDDIGVAYNIPVALEFHGSLDIMRLHEALQILVRRHDTLRTCFRILPDEPGDEPRQIIMTVEETTLLPDSQLLEGQDTAQTLLADFVRPFDLSYAPLMRVKAAVGQDRSLLLVDIHHIIADGATVSLLFEELAALYNNIALPEPGPQYKDWSEWSHSRDISCQKSYWKTMFADEAPSLNISTDFPRPLNQQFKGGHTFIRIPTAMRQAIDTLALARGATPFMVLLTALMVLFGKYANEEDVTIGSPVSGRTHPDCEHIAGMFVNTVALRGRPQRGKSFNTLLSEVKETCLQAFENQDYPFESLVDTLPWIRRDFSRNPLFDVMFALQNNDLPQVIFDDLTFLHAVSGATPARFDLTLNVEAEEDGYKVDLLYSTALFRPESAARLLRHYVTLLGGAVGDPSRSLDSLPMMDNDESAQVMGFRGIPLSPDQAPLLHKTFVALFEDQTAARPDHPALVLAGQTITYKELNRLSDAVARWLLSIDIRLEDIVAVFGGRGFGWIIGALGAMKAGAAFLPIDASTPSERTRFILEDSGAGAVLVADALLPISTALPVLALSGDSRPDDINDMIRKTVMNTAKDAVDTDDPNSRVDICPHNLAYCIYTSGTTGVPKGALLEHLGLTNLVAFYADFLKITSADTILQFASCAFDASILELTMALSFGATLQLLPPGATHDPDQLCETLRCCTIALLPPQLVGTVNPHGLRLLQTGGSASNSEIVRLAESNDSYVNAYGPSETTICATAWFHTPGEEIPVNVPIGKPLPGVYVYIVTLDKADELCAIGVPGELCIGGSGVGRGYLNRPQLTAEMFIVNPFVKANDPLPMKNRLYRTGDLARWLPDGNIEYLGRLDDQVKIRGYRVELGEVEAALGRQPGVRDAAAVVRTDPDGALTLSGYVAAAKDFDIDALRESLLRELPDYMVPDLFMRLDSLPTNTSGKVDKKILPVIETRSTVKGAAPQGERETRTARIFEDILGVEHVDADSDFFRLGGDSIKAIRMISRFRDAGYEITVREIMTHRCVRKIAQALQLAALKTSAPGSDGFLFNQEPLWGDVPLGPIQHTFFAQDYARPQHFNQAIFLYSREDLDATALHSALTAVTLHHDMLRAVYPAGIQTILPPEESALFTFTIHDLRGGPVSPGSIENTNDTQQALIDLDKGPLLRVVLYRTDDGSHLLLCAHHLVVDGVSWRILAEDLFSAYRQAQTTTHTPLLPPKTASYRDWTTLLGEFFNSGAPEAQQAYWAKILEEAKCWDVRTILGSTSGSNDISYDLAEIRTSRHITKALLYDVGSVLEVEINDILLSALALAVRRRTGQLKISIELEGHGREQLHRPLDIDRTVGWFTCCFPVILEARDNPGDTVRATRDMLLGIPHRGVSYALLAERDILGTERFHPGLSFNYLGNADSEHSQFNGAVTPSPLPPGRMIATENRLPNVLSINGAVSGGELVLTVQYESTLWEREEILNFCAAYEQALTEIVEYSAAAAATLKTTKERVSDDEDLSDEEFEEIQGLFP